MRYHTLSLFVLLLYLTTACKNELPVPSGELPEDYTPLQFQPLNEFGNCNNNYGEFIIEDAKSFEKIVESYCGYNGSYSINFQKEFILGAGVKLDHLLYEPLQVSISKSVTLKKIKVIILAKEKYNYRETPHKVNVRWVWVKLEKLPEDYSVEYEHVYEFKD